MRNDKLYSSQISAWLVAWTVLLLALTISFAPSGSAVAAVDADPPDQPFDLILTTPAPGFYEAYLDGLGMKGRSTATLDNVDLGATGVESALLLWAGLGRDEDGVLFQRDDGTPVRITADYVYNNDNSPNPTWGCCGGELSVYVADITALDLVTPGVHAYTISDLAITRADNGQEENWGFSLIAVYEDPTVENPRQVVLKLGNDGLHFRWGNLPLLGPNSDVQCLAFDPVTYARQVSLAFVIGGITDDFRPNGLWGLVGNEPYVDLTEQGGMWNQEVGLINLPANPPLSPAFDGIGIEIDGPLDGDRTGNGIDWPFSDANGLEWDEYVLRDVALDPGDEWLCVQVESANRAELPPGPDTFQLGASIGFLGFLAVIEEPPQASLAVEVEPAYSWRYGVTNAGSVALQEIRLVAGPDVAIGCPQEVLAPNERMICTATSDNLAEYATPAWVIGQTAEGVTVSDLIFPDLVEP
jgi:hypothetical protein